jgi:ribosome biogenesis GTPase
LIIQAVDRDFNLNRIERYLSVSYAGKIDPVILLSKIDLVDPELLADLMNEVSVRIRDVQILALSNLTGDGYEALVSMIKTGKTYCLLGSSGVGKSTLVNRLTGREEMITKSISDSTKKGRHTTTHREMFVLENGGVLIDNPGMREIGLTDAEGGLEPTFHQIAELSEECKYADCKHLHENECAVLEAVNRGELDRAVYDNYLKMEREKKHFESSVAERRKKDKDFGKMIKNFKKTNRR